MFSNKKNVRAQRYLGTHLLAEFLGCGRCGDTEFIKNVLHEATIASGATMLDEKYHIFRPQGMTGYILLKESHISIHTWPEYGYAAIDVFTCGDSMKPDMAIAYLRENLRPGRVTVKKILRGKVY